MSPGDQILVSVSTSYSSASGVSDSILVTDLTTGDNSAVNLYGNDYMPDRSAAGCLVLSSISPPTPLANFGYVDMHGCQVTVTVSNPNIPEISGDGNSVMSSPIGNLKPQAYQISLLEGDGNFHDATFLPSALGNGGQDFRVTWENS